MTAITGRLDRLEQQRSVLMADIDRMAAGQVTYRAAEGSWSVLEVVEHLVRVEEGILSRVRQREPRTWREATRATFALHLMSGLLLLGRRVRVPLATILPQGGVTLADLNVRWEASREALRRVFEGFGPADLARPMMRHPIIGLLTPLQTLTFIGRHVAHHRRQIARIRRSPGYPRS